MAADPVSFDSGAKRNGGYLVDTVYQQYMGADWTRGPAGSGETDFASGGNSIEDFSGPQIAESWEMPELGVWKLNVRQGVYWQKPDTDAGRLVNGRQLTADDVVASLNRLLTAPDSWIVTGQPVVAKTATIEKTGPWEVTIRTPEEVITAYQWIIQGAGFNRVYPPEVVEKYGDMEDWRNSVGTGPFMMVDFVTGSSLSYVKNPDCWEKDPIGPGKGNQLPYVDSYKELIIPDLSTTLAGLRTGKIDFLPDVVRDDALSLLKSNPELEYSRYFSNLPWGIAMHQDKPDKPFSNVKVRQALMLATDFEALKNDFFGGEAEIDVYPVNKQVTPMYQPLSEMPASVQDLFKYNPEKAKGLLSEAGYPNGFKTSIIINGVAERIDELSIYKQMWAKVGVDVSIDIRENTVYTGMTGPTHSYDDMIYRLLFGSFFIQMTFSAARGNAINNPSRINAPIGSIPFIEDVFAEYNANIFVDWPAAFAAYKKLKPFLLEQAFIIPRPTPYTYAFWQPWMKNYYGQGVPLIRYAWIDQDLKQSMQ